MSIVNVDDKEKYQTLQKYLLDEYVLVHIDPKVDGVKIPAELCSTPTVTLKLSKLFRGSLVVDQHTVTAELLFGQSYFECHIPLQSLWGMTTVKGKTLLWPTSAPQEVLQSLLRENPEFEKAAEEPKAKLTPRRKRPALTAATTPESAPPKETGTTEEKPAKTEKKRGHLRLIK